MLSEDRIAAATERLDPEDRALVQLFDRRGMSADEIAGILGLDPAEVARRHEVALDELADELDVSPSELRRELSDEPTTDERAAEEPAAEEPAAEEPGRAPVPVAPAQARTRRLLIGLLVLVLVVIVVIVIVAGGGDDSTSTESSKPPNPGSTTSTGGTTTAAPSAGPVRTLQRLNGTFGHGTVQLRTGPTGAVLRTNVSGFLQPVGGGYAVWLYNSQTDAKRVYATTATSIRRDIPLPASYRRYRYVDMARAVPTLTSPHSGISLLRAKFSSLD